MTGEGKFDRKIPYVIQVIMMIIGCRIDQTNISKFVQPNKQPNLNIIIKK